MEERKSETATVFDAQLMIEQNISTRDNLVQRSLLEVSGNPDLIAIFIILCAA